MARLSYLLPLAFLLAFAALSSAQECSAICRRRRPQVANNCDTRFCTVERCRISPFEGFVTGPFQITIGGFHCVQITPSPSPTPSTSASSTASPSAVPSASISTSPSPLPSESSSVTPTVSATPSISASASVSLTASPSALPSVSSSVSPTASPTPTASASSSVTASPSSKPSLPSLSRTSQCASSSGDPHIRTFDGLYYDCQGHGEFVMAVADGFPSFEIQARFTQSTLRKERISVAQGVAIRHVGVPVLQISFPTQEGGERTEIGSCDVLAFVNGNSKKLSVGAQKFGDWSVKLSGTKITMSAFGMNIVLRIGKFGDQCILWTISVCVPNHPDNSVIGVLGSPNGKSDDEWMTSSGSAVSYPTSTNWHLFEPAYKYCTSNWCIKKEEESLFTYESGTDFSNFMKCNEPYATGARNRPNLADVPRKIKTICKGDKACEIDGLIGGNKAARQYKKEVTAIEKIEKKFIESGGEKPVEILVRRCPDACRTKKIDAAVDCSLVKNGKKCVVSRCDGGFSCSPRTGRTTTTTR